MGETRRFNVWRIPFIRAIRWASNRRPSAIAFGLTKLHLQKVTCAAWEDLIDASPKSTAAWAKVLYHLGAWPRVDVVRVKRLRRAEAKGAGLVTSFRNAHAPQIMIHGSKPISATIGNYNAVYRVLKGTPHEWMLEQHLEPKQS